MCERCERRLARTLQIVDLMGQVTRPEAGEWIMAIMDALEATALSVGGFKSGTADGRRAQADLHSKLCKTVAEFAIGLPVTPLAHPHANPVPSRN